ncbi:MAG: phosphotransferase, partial [Nocardioides sp.]|nr:phosphotransferase [Nocardioides sp.]
DKPEVRAVLDWEMATVGDPLTDVGWLALSWVEEEGPDGVTEDLGFPSLSAVLERYRRQVGEETNSIDWYIAFACFKLAVIREGIRGRHQRGETVGAGFEEIGDRIDSVAERGLQFLDPA